MYNIYYKRQLPTIRIVADLREQGRGGNACSCAATKIVKERGGRRIFFFLLGETKKYYKQIILILDEFAKFFRIKSKTS